MPEAAGVLGVKDRSQRRPFGLGEAGNGNRQFVGLPHIAHVEPHFDPLAFRGHAVGCEQTARLGEHRFEHRPRRLGRQVAVRGEAGLHQIVPQIGEQHAQRAQYAGGGRDQETRDRELARQGRAVHRPGAAERH